MHPYIMELVEKWLTRHEIAIPKVALSASYNSDGDKVEIRVDPSTSSLQTITHEHHEIHGGTHFYLEGNVLLGNAGTLYVKLVTPDSNVWSHFLWEIESSGILTTSLKEDATGGMAGGAVVTIHANNRNKYCWTGAHDGGNGEATVMTDSGASWTVDELIGMQIFNTTDGSSGIITDNDGTTVTVAALAGGTDNDWDTNDVYEINKSLLVVTSGVTTCELVLKQNTVYCRTFLSGSSSNYVNFRASWYEHDDHN